MSIRAFFRTDEQDNVVRTVTQPADQPPPEGFEELDPDPPPGSEAMLLRYQPLGRKRRVEEIKGLKLNRETGLFVAPDPEPVSSRRGAKRRGEADEPVYDPVRAATERSQVRSIADFARYLDAVTIETAGTQCTNEKLTWDAKAAAVANLSRARAEGQEIDPNGRDRLMMRIEAALTGEDPDDTEARIAAKASRFFVVGPALSGERRRHEQRVKAAASPEQVNAEDALSRDRVALILANVQSMAENPEAFAAGLPQVPDDIDSA